MLYAIAKFFNMHFFSYTTVRSGIAFFIAFFVTIYLMPKFIKWAQKKKAEQPIYELAPKTHQAKKSTPTMGGIVFIAATVIASLICAKFNNVYVVGGILCLLGFSFLGFKDDFAKITGGKNHDGLSARAKFAFQLFISALIAFLLFFFSDLTTELYLPFYKFPIINLWFFAVIFWLLVMTAASNSVNLTDGLDGLATIPSVFSLISLGIFAYLCGHAEFSSYLLLPKVSGVGELCIIAAALVGALLGFLWYNCYPAEVFMGDSGSLSVGAFIGYTGIVTKNEFLLIIIGWVFVMETLSVILQVASFKMRKKRIFLMSPIHHHFELKGWAENKIIIRFWIIALLMNIIALTSLKLR